MGTATLGLLKSEIILPVVPEYVPVVPLCPISRPSRPMIIGPELGPLRAAKLLLVCQVDLCWSFSELLIESFWGVPWILWPRKRQNSTMKMKMRKTIKRPLISLFKICNLIHCVTFIIATSLIFWLTVWWWRSSTGCIWRF